MDVGMYVDKHIPVYTCRCALLQTPQIILHCDQSLARFCKGQKGCQGRIQGKAGRRRCKGGVWLSCVVAVEWAPLCH